MIYIFQNKYLDSFGVGLFVVSSDDKLDHDSSSLVMNNPTNSNFKQLIFGFIFDSLVSKLWFKLY